MKRPWELLKARDSTIHMEKQPPGSCTPRVYVPVSLPDSPSPTFAVLQFVGFSNSSSTAADSHHNMSPLISSMADSSLPFGPSLTVSPNGPLDSPVQGFHNPTSSPLTDNMDNGWCPYASADRASTPPKGEEKTIQCTVLRRHITENVIHTTSSEFKDVVQRLTGSSSNDQEMLPITVSPLLTTSKAVANKAISDALSVKMLTSKVGGKKANLRLHDRRMVVSKLESVGTTLADDNKQHSLPSLSLSPVTPLDTDIFEKLCGARTHSHNAGGILPDVRASNLQSDLSGNPALLNLFPESPVN